MEKTIDSSAKFGIKFSNKMPIYLWICEFIWLSLIKMSIILKNLPIFIWPWGRLISYVCMSLLILHKQLFLSGPNFSQISGPWSRTRSNLDSYLWFLRTSIIWTLINQTQLNLIRNYICKLFFGTTVHRLTCEGVDLDFSMVHDALCPVYFFHFYYRVFNL